MNRYVAFLRGINVSGHHKVPMAELRQEMAKLGCKNIVTILNSGNVIFNSTQPDLENLEKTIAEHLEKTFGFPIPTILREATTIQHLLDSEPFKDVVLTDDIRLYVSFLWKEVEIDLSLPWTSEDNSCRIIDKRDKAVISVLDLAITNTPKGMAVVEQIFGNGITTRNWNTIKRIEKKI